MSAKSKIEVIEVTEQPAQLKGYSMIMSGITSHAAAQIWGAKYGFPTVYWLKAEGKVYGVQDIAAEAQVLEEESARILQELEEQA